MLISLNKTYYYENLNMNGIDFTIILNHECKNIFNLEWIIVQNHAKDYWTRNNRKKLDIRIVH